EIFGGLLKGIATVVIDDDTVKDPGRLLDLLASRGVTRLVLVPSLLGALLETYEQFRTPGLNVNFWVSSGEPLPPAFAKRFHDLLPNSVLLNLFRSSEVVAHVASSEIMATGEIGAVVPVGKPIANSRIYVVDKTLGLTPSGVPGELLVGGAGLSRGYINRPDA